MALISELQALLNSLAAHTEIDVEPTCLAAEARKLSNDDLLAVMTDASRLKNGVELLTVVVAGLAAERSTREAGSSGFAQIHGHSTPASFIQSLGGLTRTEAAKLVRTGTSLLDEHAPAAVAGKATSGSGPESTDVTGTNPAAPWFDPLRTALLIGALTHPQHDAIRRGLGEPPLPAVADETIHPHVPLDAEGSLDIGAEQEAIIEVWRLAAEQLVTEASHLTVEELTRAARQIRDQLDPEGCTRRFGERYEKRSFRMWLDAEGLHQARLSLDDEAAAWIRTIIDAALRPRRGGPRFVTDAERATAQVLIDDPRTNDQLTYDLIIDTLKAGALADAEKVFGARQPGVRIIVTKQSAQTRDAFGRLTGTGHLEDGGDSLPGHVIDRPLCNTGTRDITLDPTGNPLNVGREQRLFTSTQRIALAIRDGGCVFPECDRVASSCEAHHIDHYAEHDGRTDIDRGILLCRFHHMQLHNHGWRITREDHGPFLLHRPPKRSDGGPARIGRDPDRTGTDTDTEPIVLTSRSPLRWGRNQPPPPNRTPWSTRAGTGAGTAAHDPMLQPTPPIE